MTESLSTDSSLPTTTEGTNLGSDTVTATDTPSVDTTTATTDPTVTDDATSRDIPVGANESTTADILPGAPTNEFEALKESLLGSEPNGTVDEVIVNVEVIDVEVDADSTDQPGVLLHEHTNYDTAVLNHPGGPYLTDVENARDAVIAERRMANNDATQLADIDKGVAEQSADANAVAELRNASNANIAEREAFLTNTNDANVTQGLTQNSTEGGLVSPPAVSPSGVTPAPKPDWTVPGVTGDEPGDGTAPEAVELQQDDAGNSTAPSTSTDTLPNAGEQPPGQDSTPVQTTPSATGTSSTE